MMAAPPPVQDAPAAADTRHQLRRGDDGSSGWQIFSPTCGHDGCGSALCGRDQGLRDPCCAQAVAHKHGACYCWVLSDGVLGSTSAAGGFTYSSRTRS